MEEQSINVSELRPGGEVFIKNRAKAAQRVCVTFGHGLAGQIEAILPIGGELKVVAGYASIKVEIYEIEQQGTVPQLVQIEGAP